MVPICSYLSAILINKQEINFQIRGVIPSTHHNKALFWYTLHLLSQSKISAD